MGVSKDQKITRYGTPDEHEPAAIGLQGGGTTVYRGTIAVTAGTGGHAGYLHAATSVATTDICWGLIDKVCPPGVDSGPGITNAGNDGDVVCEVAQGTFFLGSSTGSDQLGVATLGQTVYVYDEITVAATNGSSSRPVAGKHVGTDTTGRYPGGYAIKMGANQTPGGGF